MMTVDLSQAAFILSWLQRSVNLRQKLVYWTPQLLAGGPQKSGGPQGY